MSQHNKEGKPFAVDFVGTFYVDAANEEEAREKWENADFGEGERLEINEIRRVA